VIVEICGEETGSVMGIADGAVDEEFRVEEVSRRGCWIVGVAESVTACHTADSPWLFFEGAVVADKRCVCDVSC